MRNLVPVNALVLIALAVGLFNNALIGATFGLTRNVDAFYAAMMLPSLFMFLCVDYLGKNFLPILAVVRRESDESASQMISTVVTLMALIATVAAIVLVGGSRILFSLILPGFDVAETSLVVDHFFIMAPAIVFMAVNAFHEYVCQYDEDFVRVMAIRLALPCANLASIVLLGPVLHEYCLPIGFLAGHATMFVLLARRARYRYRPRITIRAHLEKRIFTNAAIVMSTGLIARTQSIVINVIASTLGEGAIAALAFATKLTEPLQRASFTGTRMFMFSRAARLYADNRVQELGRIYAVAVRMCFMLLVPLLAWVVFNSHAIVNAMFGRGEFTLEMGMLVGAALAASAPAVLFSGVGQLLANAFYAMGRVTIPALVLPFGMLVFVVSASILAGPLRTQGLALATTISALCVFCVFLMTLARQIPRWPWGRTALRLVGYCALGGAVLAAVTTTVRDFGALPLTTAIVSLPVGAALYFAILSAARDDAMAMVVRYGRQWLAARRLSAEPYRSSTGRPAPKND